MNVSPVITNKTSILYASASTSAPYFQRTLGREAMACICITSICTRSVWLQAGKEILALIILGVARHTLGICVNGVFDRFPGLKFIIGHSQLFPKSPANGSTDVLQWAKE